MMRLLLCILLSLAIALALEPTINDANNLIVNHIRKSNDVGALSPNKRGPILDELDKDFCTGRNPNRFLLAKTVPLKTHTMIDNSVMKRIDRTTQQFTAKLVKNILDGEHVGGASYIDISATIKEQNGRWCISTYAMAQASVLIPVGQEEAENVADTPESLAKMLQELSDNAPKQVEDDTECDAKVIVALHTLERTPTDIMQAGEIIAAGETLRSSLDCVNPRLKPMIEDVVNRLDRVRVLQYKNKKYGQ